MFLVRNESLKPVATYLNGLAVASAAIGGIGQIVANSASWHSAALIVVRAVLHLAGQPFIRRLRE
jgi:hypothetical protein